MGANPVEFDITFGSLQGAIAQWNAYSAGLETVIASSAQLGQSQQAMAQSMAQSSTAASSASSAIQAYGTSMQTAANAQASFSSASQQTVSILAGAGTSAQTASQSMGQFSGAMANVGKFVGPANGGLDDTNTLMENLAGSSQTGFEKVKQLGEGFGMASASLTGLIFSAHSLNRASVSLARTQVTLEQAHNRLADQTTKLDAAIVKYGADSQEVAAIQADMAIQTDKIAVTEQRAELQQEGYNEQLVAFATTTGPLVISTVSSMSQGIQSMGEVLKISRKDVTDFASSWGGIIGVGALVTTFAVGVVNALMSIQKANDDVAAAVARNDWAGALQSKIGALTTATQDPFAIILRGLQSLTGAQGFKSGIDIVNMDKVEKELVTSVANIKNELDAAMKSSDWQEIFRLPPNATAGLTSDVQQLNTLIAGYAKDLASGIQLDPTYEAKLVGQIKDLFTKIKAEVVTQTAQMQQIFATGGAGDIMTLIAPNPAETQQAYTQYKQSLDTIKVAFINFRQLQAAGYVQSIDDYIQYYSRLSDEDKKRLKQYADTLKKQEDMQTAATNAQVDQAVKEGLAMDARIQKTLEFDKANEAAINSQLDDAKKLDQAHKDSQALIENTVVATFGAAAANRLAGESAAQYAQRMQDLFDIGKAYQAEQDKLISGLIMNALQLGIAKQHQDELNTAMLSGKDALVQLITSNQTLIDVLNDQQRAHDNTLKGMVAGTNAAVDFIDNLNVQTAANKQLNEDLIITAQHFGIDLPAGIRLTNDQLKALITSYKETGSAAQAMALIHDQAFSDMHKIITDVVNAAVEGGKDWSKAWKGIADAIPKGQKGFFKDFFGDLADMQQAASTLNQTGAALDAFLDVTGGQMDSKMIDQFSKKFVKDIKDLRDQADDLPYVGDQLDGLLANVQAFAKSADSAEDFRILNGFIADLNQKMKDGLTADEIQALTDKWGNFFGAFAGDPSANIIKVDTALGNLINTAGSSALEDYLTGGATVMPNIDATATITTIDTSGLTDANKVVDGLIGRITSLDTTAVQGSGTTTNGTNQTVPLTGQITTVEWSQGRVGGGPSWMADFAMTKLGFDPNVPIALPAPTTDAFDTAVFNAGKVLQVLVTAVNTAVMTLPAPNTDAYAQTMIDVLTTASEFAAAFNTMVAGGGKKGGGLIIPAPNTDLYAQTMIDVLTTAQQFAAAFNSMVSGGGAKGKKGGGLIIPAPNTDLYAQTMIDVLTTAQEFPAAFNSFMTGGGKKGKKGGGLIIPAPNTDLYAQTMIDVLTTAQQFPDAFNALMGGGGGKGKKKKGGLVIPAPNMDEFITGMDFADQITLGFITTFNSAMGGGGTGGGKKKKKGGLVIPAPNSDEFVQGIADMTDITLTFVDDFTQGMQDAADAATSAADTIQSANDDNASSFDDLTSTVEDDFSAMADAASNAADDITSSFDDIGSAADDARSAVEDLQSSIDHLKGKTINIKVNISGAGVKYLAEGFHGVVNEPTLLVVGEAGPERVDVQPSFVTPSSLQSRDVNINPIFSQSALDMKRKLAKGLPDLLKDLRLPVGTGVGGLVQQLRHVTIPVKVAIDRKTLIEIVQEHMLD